MTSYATVREVILRCHALYDVRMREEGANRLVDSWHGIFKNEDEKAFVEAIESYVDNPENTRMPTPAHIRAKLPHTEKRYGYCSKCATGVRSIQQMRLQRWWVDHREKRSTLLDLWYGVAYSCDCEAGQNLTLAKWPCDGCLALERDTGDILHTMRCRAYTRAPYQVKCQVWKEILADGGVSTAPTIDGYVAPKKQTARQKLIHKKPEAKKIPLEKVAKKAEAEGTVPF